MFFMARQPSYIKVYENLKRKIVEGEYLPGDLLPPEPTLEEQFGVSRTTIRKAVECLAREGYVSVKQGKGTSVLDYVTMQNLNNVSSFTKTLQDKGIDVRPKAVHVESIPAKGIIAKSLSLAEGDPVVRVQRIQLANGQPIAIINNYLPMRVGKCLLETTDSLVSLYKFIDERCNLYPDSSVDRITAKNADFAEAQMLEVAVGTALIHVTRVCYCAGLPLSVDILEIIGSMYEFEVNLLNREL
jgi:GntR family transcriptional regulator